MPIRSWDIFCTVIDNFGDIGVCWRLARQLAQEHGMRCDCGSTIWPASPACCRDRRRPPTSGSPVSTCTWDPKPEAPFEPVTPHDVVIEAFACQLPEPFSPRWPRPIANRSGSISNT
jgi:hypothetical protein